MSLSKVGKRKIDQEGRVFQEKWERAYFFVEVQNIPTCLICKQSSGIASLNSDTGPFEAGNYRLGAGYTMN